MQRLASPARPRRTARSKPSHPYRWAVGSALVGLLLMVASMLVPRLFDIAVNSGISEYERFPPLHANWLPEVGQRIWLPFTLWILTLPALLPARWRTPLLAGQATTAILVQLLLLTRW